MIDTDKLRAALGQPALWFGEYADSHAAQGKQDKYQRNREREEFCHATAKAAMDEIDRLRAALEQADGALRNHACHGGETMPCLRSKEQCKSECGKAAGDALLVVEAALGPTL